MASQSVDKDKYRNYLNAEEVKNIEWRYGAPPNYDVVNKLFEEGRTKIWPPGSLEESVQNLVKTWEMEIFHKTSVDDFKTLDPKKYTFSLNGRKALTLQEVGKLGGYNPLLQTSLPEKFRGYNPDKETADSSHRSFTTVRVVRMKQSMSRGFCNILTVLICDIVHVYIYTVKESNKE
ncbi:hypothetical protein I3843_16G018900 [Carya illinoinensis]|nr:hypothetical protein I3843_16G018900 [Carya illinoinensis]